MNADLWSPSNMAVELNSLANSVETRAGAAWLASYIDPAHGNCTTIPDEDCIPSIALQTNWSFCINKDFFVEDGYTGDLPSSFTFSIYGTPLPQYPIMVIGYFYCKGTSVHSNSVNLKYVLVPDNNFGNIPGTRLSDLR